jgi:acetyl esterase/lipase
MSTSLKKAPLHPDAENYLASVEKMMKERKLPPLYKIEVNRRRAISKLLITSGSPPMADCAVVEEVEIPTRAGSCPGRVYVGDSSTEGDLPVVVYIHGGGFAIGGLVESEHECRALAANVPAVVVVIEYRKTPEHPYPAPDEDCYDSLLWASENAQRYGGDRHRLVLAGTSCGGCVASSIARKAIERQGPKISLVVAITPWFDKTMSFPSMKTYAQGVHLDWDETEHYRDLYLPNGADDADAYNSPAVFPAIKGMPAHYILVAECDGVSDEAYAYAEALRGVGTPVSVITGKGLIHAFTLLFHLIPVAKTYLPGVYQAIKNADL